MYVLIYMALEDWENAATWINRFLQSEQVGIRQDLHCFARILQLIIHYELGNTELISYFTISTYRFISKRESLYQFEKILLRFIKNRLGIVMNKGQMIEEFRKTKEQLEAIRHDPYEKQPFRYYDFIGWLDSKISGQSFQKLKTRQYHQAKIETRATG